MTIKNQGDFGLQDYTPLTELVERQTNMLEALGLYTPYYGSTTTAEVERVTDGSDTITATERGGDRNFASKENSRVESFRIPFYTLDFKSTPADVQDIREYGTVDTPLSTEKRIERTVGRIRRSHYNLNTLGMYTALKGTSMGGGQYTKTFSAVWDVAGDVTTADVDFTAAAVNPAQTIEKEAREHIQAQAQDNADAYQVICLCGSGWFNGFTNHPLVQAAYDQYPSESEPLRKRLGGNLVNRSFEHKGITYLEDNSGQVARGDAYILPLGIADMFQQHYAPADTEEHANTIAQELYIFLNKGDRSTKVESETSFQCINTRPELVVKSTGTLNAED